MSKSKWTPEHHVALSQSVSTKVELHTSGKRFSSLEQTGPYSVPAWRCLCAQTSTGLKWKNWSFLHRDLISIPLNTSEIKWNSDCIPGLLTHHHVLTSLKLFWLNEQKPLQLHSNNLMGGHLTVPGQGCVYFRLHDSTVTGLRLLSMMFQQSSRLWGDEL